MQEQENLEAKLLFKFMRPGQVDLKRLVDQVRYDLMREIISSVKIEIVVPKKED